MDGSIHSHLCYEMFSPTDKHKSAMNKQFWWGYTKDKCCEPKNNGGLRFRNIKDFNAALLNKQRWCILTNLDSSQGEYSST